jgi:RNHCP domain-containing protein
VSERPPTEYNFTCEHCHKPVPWGELEGEPRPRNHCPFCLWSKHVAMGEQVGYPPCGAMQRGVDVSDGDGAEVVWRCLGCGFMMRAPTDDYLFRVFSSGLVKSLDGAVLYGRGTVESTSP